MTRVTTLDELNGARVRRTTAELLELQGHLARRITTLDRRVSGILDIASPMDDDAVAQVDVLTTAICELQELLTEVVAELDRGRRGRRRVGLRRW